MLRRVGIGGFVGKIRRFAQNEEAMGNPLAKGVRALSEGDRNVIHFALSGPSQITLRLLNLIMQAAQDILALLGYCAAQSVVQGRYLAGSPGFEAFEEHAPVVAETFGSMSSTSGRAVGTLASQYLFLEESQRIFGAIRSWPAARHQVVS